MLTPKNGYGQPCCAECAEFNAQGCPGNSPHCIQDRHRALDHQAQRLQDGVDELLSGIEAVTARAVRESWGTSLETSAANAIDALAEMRAMLDESNSEARSRRVVEA